MIYLYKSACVLIYRIKTLQELYALLYEHLGFGSFSTK